MIFKRFILLLICLLFLSSCSSRAEIQLIQEDTEPEEELETEVSLENTHYIFEYKNNSERLEIQQEELISQYIEGYFKSLADLEVNFPRELFFKEADLQILGNETIWELVVEIRKLQEQNLNLNDYSYDLTIVKNSVNDDGDTEVRVVENNTQTFSAYPDIQSEQNNILHLFIFTEQEDEYKIKRHLQFDGINFLIMEDFMQLEDDITADNSQQMELLIESKEYILNDAAANIIKRKADSHVFTKRAFVWDNDYDRLSAVDYSYRWAGARNPQWPYYDMMGGNCVNYTSQSVFSGGVPMDIYGSDQWKWYSDDPNSYEEAEGRSPSWSGVDNFYNYAKDNLGYGLVATTDFPYYNCEPGDIIQMGLQDDWKHAVIITQVLSDEEGNTVDYLINSNTADMRDFPASAYVYTMQRAIKIHGWNDI